VSKVVIDYTQWQSCDHEDEPHDQQRDLPSGLWAEVGPDSRRGSNEWSWLIMDFDRDNAEVASGFAPTEVAAKSAVAQWEQDRFA
jgi:hypothetical protein